MGEERDWIDAGTAPAQEGYGFFNRVGDARLFSRIQRKVSGKGYFTDRVTLERVTLRLSDIVLVVSPDDQIAYVSHARPTRIGTTGTRSFKANGPVAVNVELRELESALTGEALEQARRGIRESCFRPSLSAWQAIWEAIKAMRPNLVDQFRRIEQLRFDESFQFDAGSDDEQIFYEKDAVGVALDVAGISFGGVFAELATGRQQDLTLVESLCGAPIEDLVVNHDTHTFPDYTQESDRLHSCEFVQHGRRLVVFNVNRRPAEIALGVDLIYHNLTYNAFTFVQYKMLEREGGALVPVWRYRLNDQFDREIARMRSARNDLRARAPAGPDCFRMGDDPFYFKLCRRQHLKVNSGQLVSGAYINLTHCDLVLNGFQTGEARVLQPGRTVSRWLNRTQFTDLVAKGWIGTNQLTDAALASYVDAALEARRSVVIAQAEARRAADDEDEDVDEEERQD